jgi:hypothetical protein
MRPSSKTAEPPPSGPQVSDVPEREIRRYAEAVEAFFALKMPVTHAAFVQNDRMAPKITLNGAAGTVLTG